ncbi:hypothetical protein BGS_0646 [Beggiatoa sp. SS]|nr:hypothetical protein BGS_0646 [Beggiatoa sp. SS]
MLSYIKVSLSFSIHIDTVVRIKKSIDIALSYFYLTVVPNKVRQMEYTILRYFHVLGAILMGAGLIGVWLTDLRSRQQRDVVRFSEAVRYIAIFYDFEALKILTAKPVFVCEL